MFVQAYSLLDSLQISVWCTRNLKSKTARRWAPQVQSNRAFLQVCTVQPTKSARMIRRLIEYILDPVRCGEPVLVQKKDIGDGKENDRKYWIDREIKFSRDLLHELRYSCPVEKLFGSWLFDQEGNTIVYDEDEILEFHKMKAVLLKNVSIKVYRDKFALYDRVILNAISALIRPSHELVMENKSGFIAMFGEEEKIVEIEEFINSSYALSKHNFAISVKFEEEFYDNSAKDFWPVIEARVLKVAKERYDFFCSLDHRLSYDEIIVRETPSPKAYSRLFPIVSDLSARLRLRNQTMLFLIGHPVYNRITKTSYRQCQLIGGRRKFAESTLASAKRTFTEETGIPLDSLMHSDGTVFYGPTGMIFLVNVKEIYAEFTRFKSDFNNF
jgi:hypothetical protein